ncbi:MAG: ankyrin repeat domain-containing protein [Acidobacteriota bacterium]
MMKTTKAMLALWALACSTVWLAGGEIHEAVKRGDLAATRALLDEDPALLNQGDLYALSPLHWAALKGHRDMASLLLARGADINQKTRLAQTPLHIAIQHNHQDVASLLREKGADQTPWRWPRIVGEYVGEDVPGATPRLFSPEILSSILFDHSAPAFTQDGAEVFWAVVFEDDTGILLSMKRDGDAWSELKQLPFSEARFRDICPTLSSDGKTLYFTSCRPARDAGKAGDYNMWSVEREGGGWTEPRLLAPEISSGKDARPAFTKDGTMYFGSWREGAVDGTNIFVARLVDGKFEKPKRLDASFNTSNVMPTYVAPDESLLIFESFRSGGIGGSDFWMSAKKPDGTWGPAVNLGEPINSRNNDWFGGFSPDGKYFFFVSDRNGSNDMYWVDAGLVLDLKPKGLSGAATNATGWAESGIEVRDRYGLTPLHLAALRGQLDEIEKLIDSGAEINAKAPDGRTPLHEALASGKCAAVEMLCRKGADTSPPRFPVLTGEYLGQKKPGHAREPQGALLQRASPRRARTGHWLRQHIGCWRHTTLDA